MAIVTSLGMLVSFLWFVFIGIKRNPILGFFVFGLGPFGVILITILEGKKTIVPWMLFISSFILHVLLLVLNSSGDATINIALQ